MNSSPYNNPKPFGAKPFGSQPNDITIKATEVPPERLHSKKVPLTDRGNIPLNAPTPVAPETLQKLDPLLRRVLNRIPADVIQSFDDRQIKALNKAIINPSKHSVDIRKTLPLFTKRFYFVFLAGPERRAPERLASKKRPWSTASTALFTVLTLALGLTIYQVVYRRMLNPPSPKVEQNQPTEAFHPTALPWIETQAECKGKQRQWKDGFCYDLSHQPEFRRSIDLMRPTPTQTTENSL